MSDYNEALETLTNIRSYRAEEANLEDRIEQLEEELRSSHTSNMSATPVSGGGSRTEDRWNDIIDQKGKPADRLRELKHYIKRFDRAWGTLNEEEQNILEAFFVIGGYRCFKAVNDKSHIGGRSTIYNRRKTALQKYLKAYG